MRESGRGKPTAYQYDRLQEDHQRALERIRDLEARLPRAFVSDDGRTTLTADGETWILKAEARGFPELVETVRAIVEHDYPESTFNGSPEPGSRFVADLRSALRRFEGTMAKGEERPSGMAELQWAVFKFREHWRPERSESTALAAFEKSDQIGVWFFTCFTGIDAIQRAYTTEVQRAKRQEIDLSHADALYVAVPLEGPDQVQVQMTGSWQADADILKAGSRRPAAAT